MAHEEEHKFKHEIINQEFSRANEMLNLSDIQDAPTQDEEKARASEILLVDAVGIRDSLE